mgnify:CR=1 FL=1
MRTLAKKFSLKSKFQVYKKFRYKLKVSRIKNIFMNNSGMCIREITDYHRIKTNNIFVFHDGIHVIFHTKI